MFITLNDIVRITRIAMYAKHDSSLRPNRSQKVLFSPWHVYPTSEVLLYCIGLEVVMPCRSCGFREMGHAAVMKAVALVPVLR